MGKPVVIIDESRPKGEGSTGRDDLAYLLPMGVFLAFTWAGGQWESFYPASYVLKTLTVPFIMLALRRHYTPIRWNAWWLGILIGVVGVVQWIGMEKLLLQVWPGYPRMTLEPFKPFAHFSSPQAAWAFCAVHLAGASLLVPFMEELFWRDYVWRTAIAPADFKLAEVGERNGLAFFLVAAVFAAVHMHMWMTAIVWGLLIGALLWRTRSLGACIIAHGTTNLLLGLYVLHTKQWWLW